MSGWTILSVRGSESRDYSRAKFDESDRYTAVSDIASTMEEDSRVHEWTTWKDYVYAYLACNRYNFEFAEGLMEDYGEMIDDAVVLGANDTTDTGVARYYYRPDLGLWSHEYEETQKGDGYHVGEVALMVVGAKESFVARDPFHNNCGEYGRDERRLDRGDTIHSVLNDNEQ